MNQIFKLFIVIILVSYQCAEASHQPDYTDIIQYYTAQTPYKGALTRLKGVSDISINGYQHLQILALAAQNPTLKVGLELYRDREEIVWVSTLELNNNNIEEIVVTLRKKRV